MRETPTLHFGPFRLDPVDERLWRGDEPLRLTRKAYSVLAYLMRHPQQLVTRDALLEAVWSTTHKSDSTLAMCIRELRRALGDNARSPQLIETVRGRGYRFLVSVSTRPVAAHEAPRPALTLPSMASFPSRRAAMLVGRESDVAQLEHWLADAVLGNRQVGFVAGEPGIGKTALVDHFVDHQLCHDDFPIGRGQCIDQYGVGEAYLPLLDALGRLCRRSEGRQLVEILRQHAPSWLVQMPSLLTPQELDALQRREQETMRERMLRELAEAIEIMTVEQPLLLVLEDLHWSDVSTLDWLAFIARRRDPARLLILGTYRPVEVIVREHPLRALAEELCRQGHCSHLNLDYLSESSVAEYLTRRFEGAALPSSLSEVIHRRTNGNPLFMVAVVEEIIRHGVLREEAGRLHISAPVESVAKVVPKSLRELVTHQFAQLARQDRDVLEVASVAGVHFSTTLVAAGVERAEEQVDERCAALADENRFIQCEGSATWPDGTVSGRYRFAHSFYQEVIYDRVPGSRRARLHRQIGTRIENAFGHNGKGMAAELAVHFGRGADTRRATHYLQIAGEHALHRSAYTEAIAHLTQGLRFLAGSQDTRERDERELALQSHLGAALVAAKGYAWPETGRSFARARQLCRALGRKKQLLIASYGMCLFHLDRGELIIARGVADETLELAHAEDDATSVLLAHRLVGTCAYFQGDLVAARKHLELALSQHEPERHRSLMYTYSVDVRVALLSWLSRVLVLLGYPDKALELSGDALSLARDLTHPHSEVFALRDACFIPQLLGDIPVVLERAQRTVKLATEHGFSFELEEARIHHGWALAASGQEAAGIAEMERGMASYRATGSEFQMPYFLALLASAREKLGQHDSALPLLAEALERVEQTQERWFESELHRRKGELLISTSKRGPGEACLMRARQVATAQGARLFELRAAVGLARLWSRNDRSEEARNLITSVCAGFTEGFSIGDLREAKELLQSMR